MKNPTTNEEYTDPEEFIESLINSYIATKAELHKWEEDELLLIHELDKACGFPDEIKGRFRAVGIQHVAAVDRRTSVTYEKERGDEHPLRGLLRLYPDILEDKLRISYSESGSKIEKLITKIRESGGTEDEVALVEEILKTRRKKSGKPGITIEDRKDATRTEED